MVRAKFKVTERKLCGYTGGEGSETTEMINVVLDPVYSTNPQHENRRFWDSTPCGKIEMAIRSKGAADQLELGKEYFVDFTEAPPTVDD